MRVLHLWEKNGVFTPEVINHLLQMGNGEALQASEHVPEAAGMYHPIIFSSV